jgi:hypothetical protein
LAAPLGTWGSAVGIWHWHLARALGKELAVSFEFLDIEEKNLVEAFLL